MNILKAQLEAAAKDRASDVTGEKVPVVHMLPETLEDAPTDLPESFHDLASYYRTPRATIHEHLIRVCREVGT